MLEEKQTRGKPCNVTTSGRPHPPSHNPPRYSDDYCVPLCECYLSVHEMCLSPIVVDSVGYFVDPTIIQVTDPKHQIMQEVCLHLKQVLLILPEHWLSSNKAKLTSRITCLFLKLFICCSVCVRACVCVCMCHVYTLFSSSAGDLWSCAGGVRVPGEGVGKYSSPHQ